MKRIVTFFAALALPATGLAQGAPPDYETALGAFRQAAQDEQVAGGAVWLIRDGEILARDHFGMADVEASQPADDETIYHWASITKTFTAIALMQLVERGMVSLDDPVVKHVPAFAQAHNPYGDIADVTVGHLLGHTSGLREGTWPWNADGQRERPDWQVLEPPGWEQLQAMFPYTGLQYAPGTAYSYSNPGSTLMGKVVERVTGDDIEVYVDKNILKPLGMYRTYFDLTPWHLRGYRSNSYRLQKGRLVALGREFDTGVTSGNGGLNAPLGDMKLYLDFLLNVGDNANYDTILPRETLKRMWQPTFKTGYDPRVTEWMAQTFFVIDAENTSGESRRYVGHTGSQQGFRSFFYIDPASGSAVMMVVNTTNDDPRPLLYDFREALLERVFPRLAGGD
jgi:CubicO group peptidase (beta-lactamase class C family)